MSGRVTIAFGVFVFGLVVACFGSPPPKPDPVAMHTGLVEMKRQFESCRSYCYVVAPANLCSSKLGAAHDAVTFVNYNPTGEGSDAAIGCAGLSIKLSLESLKHDFRKLDVDAPLCLHQAIMLGTWASKWATPNCDPEHPTTSVLTVEDRRIPRVTPEYPSWNTK